MATLTSDHKHEMALHTQVTIATDVAVYFCDPRSRGNAARTKIQTTCSANTFPTAMISRTTRSGSSTRSRDNSIRDHEKCSAEKHRPLCCQQLLHRPVESARIILRKICS